MTQDDNDFDDNGINDNNDENNDNNDDIDNYIDGKDYDIDHNNDKTLMTPIMISTMSRLTTWENLLDSISHVGPLTTNPIQVITMITITMMMIMIMIDHDG